MFDEMAMVLSPPLLSDTYKLFRLLYFNERHFIVT
jgi:hypothetical protein